MSNPSIPAPGPSSADTNTAAPGPADPPGSVTEPDPEEDHVVVAQQRAGVGVEDCTATKCEHPGVGRQGAGDDVLLECTEPRLSVVDEDLGDGATGRTLDELVGVQELDAEALRDLAPDRRLAGTHRTDENGPRGGHRNLSVSR